MPRSPLAQQQAAGVEMRESPRPSSPAGGMSRQSGFGSFEFTAASSENLGSQGMLVRVPQRGPNGTATTAQKSAPPAPLPHVELTALEIPPSLPVGGISRRTGFGSFDFTAASSGNLGSSLGMLWRVLQW